MVFWRIRHDILKDSPQDAKTRSPTIADKTSQHALSSPAHNGEDATDYAAEQGEELAHSAPGQPASGGSEEENTAAVKGILAGNADPLNVSLTGMANTGVMFAEDAAGERFAIEGNCCVALAQSALKDGRHMFVR